MGKYFGTDGFRGEANKNLTADHAYKIGRFLGWYYGEVKRRNGDDTPARIVIGKDTRRSSYMFEYTLVGGLVDELEAAGIRKKGVGGWIKSFTEPIAIVTPINILEVFIKPLSLCMRLFGNVLGAFVIMELLKLLVPVALPVPFSFYFDIFDGLIQAYVFVFLTSMYIKEAIE